MGEWRAFLPFLNKRDRAFFSLDSGEIARKSETHLSLNLLLMNPNLQRRDFDLWQWPSLISINTGEPQSTLTRPVMEPHQLLSFSTFIFLNSQQMNIIEYYMTFFVILFMLDVGWFVRLWSLWVSICFIDCILMLDALWDYDHCGLLFVL